MLTVNTTKDELIITEKPTFQLVLGISSSLVLIFITFYLPFYGGLFSFPGFALLITSICCLLFATVKVRTINKKLKNLTISQKNLLESSFNIYKYNEMEAGLSLEKRNTGKSTTCYAQIITLNGDKLDFLSDDLTSEAQFYDLVDLANKYLLNLDDNDYRLTIINNDRFF